MDELIAPGISITTLIRLTPEPALQELLGNGVRDVLGLLDPGLMIGDSLRQLVIRMIDPDNITKDRVLREKLINMLPLAKARELAVRLGVNDGRNLYRDLVLTADTKEAGTTLKSFFGIVDNPVAGSRQRLSSVEVTATYGLFEHQILAARKVHAAFIEPPRKVVLHMPTGAGKTRTAMHIVAEHLSVSGPSLVCWLAQSAELLEQAASEFERAWGALGNRPVRLWRFWGDHFPDLEDARDGLLVSGLGKLHALSKRDPNMLLKLGDRATLTVVDEAHQSIAPTYRSLISALYTKRHRNALLGLTATPGRTWADIDADAQLAEFFGKIKVMLEVDGYDDPVDYLIAEGYLARPTFRTLNSEAGMTLGATDIAALADALEVPEAILDRLAEDHRRNIRIITMIEELLARHKRVILFATTVGHARLIAAILSARGHEADVVTGETDSTTRERVIRRFKGKDARPMVLCNFGVLTTGFDAPAISAAVIARPTRSLVLFSQMVGRATRGPRAGGNAEAEIVTVIDPQLPGFGSVADAFTNWEDVWND